MHKYREPNIFDKTNAWIDGAEGSFINLLTAIAPWLAPTPPAYMTFVHASNASVLNFPTWVAFAVAFVVEVLGLATVSTGIKFWKYNQKNRRSSEYKKAPVELVIAAFVFYLAVIITSNVILDATGYFAPENTNYAIVAVKAFYTLLTIPAALIISVRQQHKDILEEASQPKPTQEVKLTETYNKGWRTARKSLTMADMQFIYSAQVTDIMRQYSLSERTAYNWQEYAKKELDTV